MLDRVQAGTRGKHPAREDTLDLALERDFIDLDESVGIGRFDRRARVAHSRGNLQRAELHRFVDPRVEGDDAAGDLIEAEKYGARIFDLLCRHLGDDRIVGLR
jgi:hypothetical protein